jgi:diguanylate cyclase (GGDEF)-like protein
MIIGELMTAVKMGVAPTEPLASVVAMMSANKYSCAVICEQGVPRGIFTERDAVDILDKIIGQRQDANIAISEVMSKDLSSVLKTTPLYDALLLIRKRRLRHLIVMDEHNQLAGVVTQSDIVAAYVTMFEQQEKLESANQALYLLSNEDELMRIGNRRAMMVELNFTAASARRYDKTYSIALLDVDYFKKYNDHYGHQLGDDALKSMVDAVKSNMRDTDRLFRYGGEELLLIMPETNLAEAAVAAERVRNGVEILQREHKESPFGQLTLSIGVATGHKDPWLAVVKAADAALYQAKESGRNKVVCDQTLNMQDG